MNIQVPWKMRRHNGPQGSQHGWTRRKHRDELDVAKRPNLMVEDDLDHLGALHKHSH